MMQNKLIQLIDNSIEKLNEYIINSRFDRVEQKQIIKVLEEIKNDLKKSGEIRERLLRGYKDICTSTAINFEEASYADSIFEIKNALELICPKMKELKILGMDYGKGDPV